MNLYLEQLIEATIAKERWYDEGTKQLYRTLLSRYNGFTPEQAVTINLETGFELPEELETLLQNKETHWFDLLKVIYAMFSYEEVIELWRRTKYFPQDIVVSAIIANGYSLPPLEKDREL